MKLLRRTPHHHGPLAATALIAALALAAGCGDNGKTVKRNDQGIVGTTFNGLTVDLPERPIAIAAGEGGVWVTSMAGGVVSQIDPATGKAVGKPVITDDAPYAIDVAFGKVWVATFENDRIVRIDPRTRKVIDRVKVDNRPFGMEDGYGYMWVTSIRGQSISRLDPVTGKRVGDRIKLSGVPYQVTAGHGYIWVTNIRDGMIDKIDPQTGKRVGAPIKTGNFPGAIASGGKYIWVANVRGTQPGNSAIPHSDVWRIDPRTGRRVGAPIPVPIRPQAIAADNENVWVASVDGDTLLHIDAKTGARDKLPILIGNAPTDIALTPAGSAGRRAAVWVTVSKEDVVARFEPRARPHLRRFSGN